MAFRFDSPSSNSFLSILYSILDFAKKFLPHYKWIAHRLEEVLIHLVLGRVYSWMASIPASRLPPLYFTPPKGEIGDIAL